MSGDEKSLQHLNAADEDAAKGTETPDFCEAIAKETSDDCGHESLSACAVGGITEELPARAVGGITEELPAHAVGAILEGLPAVVVGGIFEGLLAGAVGGVTEDFPAGAVGGVTEEFPAGAVGGVTEEFPAGAAGGVTEKFPAGAAGGVTEEFPVCSFGGITEEWLLGALSGSQEECSTGAIGGDQEDSTASGSVPSIILGIEDIQQAYILNLRNQIREFQIIRDELMETVRTLRQTLRRNPGNWAMFQIFRQQIEDSYLFLTELKEAMSNHELREEYMNIQIYRFFERRREEGDNFQSRTKRLGIIDGVHVTVKVDYTSPDVEENLEKRKIAKAVIDHLMKGESARLSEEEFAEARREAEDAIRMDIRRAIHEPRAIAAAAAANVDEERDDEERLPHPIVTGRYTLAIKAHELYPDSSSEESPPPEEV